MSFDELMSEYALGNLPSEARDEVELMMTTSSHLRREMDAAAEALAIGVVQGLPTVAAPRPLRDRLLATLAGPDRFAPFMPALSKLFELPIDAVRSLLARADGEGAFWESRLHETDLPGTELFHFQVGPTLAVAGAAGGVLRLRPGATFPRHTHGGDETTFVLEGAFCIDKKLIGPGATFATPKGATHQFSAAPERSLLVMVLHHGISFDGVGSVAG